MIMFINYAHRGASAYAPENTLSAFYLGLEMGANGIETDIRRTKDGQLVLFHDATLEQAAGLQGGVDRYTLQELRKVMIYGRPGFIPDHIVTLDEFMYYFGYRQLTFAIELKENGVEADSLDSIKSHGAADKCIFTSFNYSSLVCLRKHDADVRIGYLFRNPTSQVIGEAKAINCFQVCPHVDMLNADNVKQLKKEGFSVRAWGITDENRMGKCIAYGVDGGMTINFPDKLTAAMKKAGLDKLS